MEPKKICANGHTWAADDTCPADGLENVGEAEVVAEEVETEVEVAADVTVTEVTPDMTVEVAEEAVEVVPEPE